MLDLCLHLILWREPRTWGWVERNYWWDPSCMSTWTFELMDRGVFLSFYISIQAILTHIRHLLFFYSDTKFHIYHEENLVTDLLQRVVINAIIRIMVLFFCSNNFSPLYTLTCGLLNSLGLSILLFLSLHLYKN